MRELPDTQGIEVLLFDLGGVLLELNDPLATFGFESDRAAIYDRWISSPSVRELERGAIDVEQFSRRFAEEASLPCGPEEFLERFSHWPLAAEPSSRADSNPWKPTSRRSAPGRSNRAEAHGH